jgi:hypothetical protein
VLSTGDEYWKVLLGLARVSYESWDSNESQTSDVPFIWP